MSSVDTAPIIASRVQDLLAQWPAPTPLPATASEHQQQICQTWPDVLRCAAQVAGHAELLMDEALNQVAHDPPLALRTELGNYHHDFEAGLPPAAALRNLADHCNVPLVVDTVELMIAGMERHLPAAPFLLALVAWLESNGRLGVWQPRAGG